MNKGGKAVYSGSATGCVAPPPLWRRTKVACKFATLSHAAVPAVHAERARRGPDISSSGITHRPAETEPRRFWKLKENAR